jgi:serine/threonine protein kinase
MKETIVAGRYRILREIGRGGMGVVYQAQHLNTGETLALKALLAHSGEQEDILERFKREMRAPALIKSDHVVRITDADVSPELGGALFLVMELLDGADLDRLLQKRGPFSPEEAVWLLGQAARALDKAHAAGIVHRDLKPENLFLHRREDGGLIVKLLDFGIARLSDRDMGGREAKVTKSGAILGTPMYLSPEQAMGEPEEVGPHSDVWAMGLIAFELLVGKTYFQGDGVTRLIGQICFQPLPPASARGSTLGPAFDRWFERACTRDAKARWPSVGAEIAALAETLGLPPSLLQNMQPPASLSAGLRRFGNQSDPETAVPKPASPESITAGREGRTTTSEGRGQSSSRLRAPRWVLGVLIGVVAIGLLGLGALIRERSKPPVQLGRETRSAGAPTPSSHGPEPRVEGPRRDSAEAPPPASKPTSPRDTAPSKAKGEAAPAVRKRPSSPAPTRPPARRPGPTGYDPVSP